MSQFHRGAHKPKGLLLAGIAVATVMTASAAAAEGAHSVGIAAGPLDGALVALANQTHEQLLYSPDLVAGRRAPAVAGNLTAEQALARLLEHLDITVTRAGREVVVLRRRTSITPASAPRTADVQAPEVVQGRPFAGDGPTDPPQVPVESRTATRPATTVEGIEVTGTHIRGVQSASPLLVVSREELDRTGEATLVGALRTLPEVFSGGEAESTQATGANPQGTNSVFATGLNLRGLGANATLVLVNGRRIANSGAFGDFADVSAIPTAAVQRVEILLDGASALYGSDAVGGVVNIILRRDYDGAEVRLEGGEATQGRPTEDQLSATFGRRWRGGGLVASAEIQQRSALPAADRPFTATTDLRPLGGTDRRVTTSFPGNILLSTPAGLVPSFAIPAGQNGVGLTAAQLLPGVVNLTNQRAGAEVLPRQTLEAVYLSADQALGERLQMSGDLRFSHREYSLHITAPTSSLTVTRANPFYVSPIGAASEIIAYSFQGDLPPSVQAGSAQTVTATLGGTLKLPGDWRSEGYLAFGQEIDHTHSTGLLNSGFLSEALGTAADNPATAFSTAANGFFNPFSGIPGSNKAAISAFIGSGEVGSYTRDEVRTANLQADGTVWTLPSGPMKLAFGVQERRESLVRTGFNLVSGVIAVPSAVTNVHRSITAAYAELQVPLVGPDTARPGLERLELSLAGRLEHYENIGSTRNPKIGVLWQPTPDLTVRGTYGTSFRAPELRELFDTATYSPTLIPFAGASVRTLVLSGGNVDLRPETATSWTAGLDFRPRSLPGFSLALTWFDTRFRDRINRPVLANLAGSLGDPTLASFVQRISPVTNAADLATINALLSSPNLSTLGGVFPATAYGAIVDARFVNTASLAVSGLDLTTRYGFDVGEDRLTLGASGTYLLRYKQQITPTAVAFSSLNVSNFPLRFRGRATADWTHGRLTGGLALNYTNAYRDALGTAIDAQATLDLQLRLAPPDRGAMKGVSVALNVRNLFDKAPPFYNNPFGYGYDPSNGDPIGRFVSLKLTRTW